MNRLDACQCALDDISRRLDDAEARTDPPVSERQRRAMRAAAGGSSALGIPKSVGEEFSEADPGGELPETKKDAGGFVVVLGKPGQKSGIQGGKRVSKVFESKAEAATAARALVEDLRRSGERYPPVWVVPA